jgi:hypothetical protein
MDHRSNIQAMSRQHRKVERANFDVAPIMNITHPLFPLPKIWEGDLFYGLLPRVVRADADDLGLPSCVPYRDFIMPRCARI